ncbi:hypothetical protein BN14_08850 [Rhizoctonia solani AG-1 IB]|uniref:Uncharacterized protein n=1 Tax=Thanatephorus cucumeris (strain AG1-IB / isolate 7/3/14) TaxID=1108050 RepID=M5C456_THACB|nr:hypothetical protein BN14_08850 [Rhizoctonia solani AG-1 IB]
MAGVLDPVSDKVLVLLKSEESSLVADPVNSAHSVGLGAATGSAGTACALALKDTADTSPLLARYNPPFSLADGLLQGGVDDFKNVSDCYTIWVLRNGDPGVKLGD